MLSDEDVARIAEAVIERVKELRRVDEIARAVLARSGDLVRKPVYCFVPPGGDTFTCDEGTNYVCNQYFECQQHLQTNLFSCRGQGQQEFYCQVSFHCVADGNESDSFDCANFTCAGGEGAYEYDCMQTWFSCGANDVNFRCGLQEGDIFLCALDDGVFECTVPPEAGDFVCSSAFYCGGENPGGSPVFRCDRPDPFACAQYECPEHTTFSEG